uniref:Ig-like domain-containing protein n=1 Tax=Methanobrevibacter sp. TaxID=66852 RepID=UPI00388EBD21
LHYNTNATGRANIFFKGEKYGGDAWNEPLNNTITIKFSLLPDIYNVTIEYFGNRIFEGASANATLIVNKLDPELTVDAPTVSYGEDIVLNLNFNDTATGTADIAIAGPEGQILALNQTLNKTLTFDNTLKPGNYIVSVYYHGNEIFNETNIDVNLTIDRADITPKITLNDTVLTVSVPEDATGNITLTVGNETLKSPIEDGTAIFDLSNIPAGDYNATLAYPGDDKYAGFKDVYPVSIEGEYILVAEDLVKYYGGPERFTVNLTDGKGRPVANAIVNININGAKYDRTTDENGQAFMAVNWNSGEYPVVVTYNDTSVNATVTVLSTVNGTDLVKVFRNATQFYATFLDSQGNYLAKGTVITFNINGVFYNRTVEDKGLAKLNINLNQGKYIITSINTVTGESTGNNITVIPKIIENSDITKYFRNRTQYTVKVISDDGKAVGAGEIVTFNINGVLYNRTTNESGIAKLNINLHPGDYIITAEYKGSMVSNNIKVLPVLNATDISMNYRDGTQFKATLVDGQGKPYAGQSVSFNINGVLYNRPTDSTGTAKLNINLMPGEYIITSSYNGTAIANKITIKS